MTKMKNTLERINSRLKDTEEQSSDREDRTLECNQAGKKKIFLNKKIRR